LSTQQFNRRSIRLKEYDYSRPGYYFVTICTRERECLLGSVSNSIMTLNETGKLAEKAWRDLTVALPMIRIGRFMVMPNHLHGIVRIREETQPEHDAQKRGLMNQTPTQSQNNEQCKRCGTITGFDKSNPYVNDMKQWILMKDPSTTLGKIIRHFKAKSALTIRKRMGNSFSWQRNYFEHIIRDRKEFFQIGNYIKNNPANWPQDDDNPVKYK